MACQSDSHLSFSAEEVEFMAEDELIETVPNMRMDALNLVRSLLEDIQNVRFYKKGINLEDIQGFAHAMKIKKISAMEVNMVRPFVVRALQVFYKHDSPEMIDQVEPPTIQRPPTTDNIPRRVVRRADLRGIRWPLDS